MKKFDFSFKNFISKPGIHCHWSPVSNIFRNKIENFDDSIIFFEQDGFTTYYKSTQTGLINNIILSNHISTLYPKFFERFNFKFEYSPYSGGFKDLLNDLRLRLPLGLPIIISLDSTKINYNRAYSSIRSNIHFVAIIGAANGRVLINDCFIPTNPVTQFQDYVNIEEIKEAWLSSQKRVLLIQPEHVRIIENYMKDKNKGIILKDKLNYYLLSNSTNLELFACDIKSILDNFDQYEMKNNIRDLCFKIQFDSIIPSRRKLMKVINDSRYINVELIAEMEEILAKWFQITLLLMKYGLAGSRNGLHKLSETILQLLQKENEIFFKIQQLF